LTPSRHPWTTLRRDGLALLAEYLRPWYEGEHVVTLYEASPYPLVEPIVATMPLAELPDAEATALSTLYVPPLEPRPRDPEMMERLGLGSG
jgi:tetrapyrrole methylase family protein / MazG family protein